MNMHGALEINWIIIGADRKQSVISSATNHASAHEIRAEKYKFWLHNNWIIPFFFHTKYDDQKNENRSSPSTFECHSRNWICIFDDILPTSVCCCIRRTHLCVLGLLWLTSLTIPAWEESGSSVIIVNGIAKCGNNKYVLLGEHLKWACGCVWWAYLNVFPYVINLFDPSKETSSTEWWFAFAAPLIIGFFVYGGSYFIRVDFLLLCRSSFFFCHQKHVRGWGESDGERKQIGKIRKNSLDKFL